MQLIKLFLDDIKLSRLEDGGCLHLYPSIMAVKKLHNERQYSTEWSIYLMKTGKNQLNIFCFNTVSRCQYTPFETNYKQLGC